MGYLKNITRFSGADNPGGLTQLQVIRKADVVAIPSPSGNTIYGSITFGAGQGVYTFDVTLESPRIQSKEKTGREGASKTKTLPFSIPKDRDDIRFMLQQMENDEFIVLLKDGTGRQKIFGQLHAPVLFSFNHDSGAKIADSNNYACQFYYTGPDNEFFYNGTLTAAPAGPAPAIVKFNGVAIASLAPGETLNINSNYSLSQYFVTS